MLTIVEQQRVKKIRSRLAQLHLKVTVDEGDHSPSDLRMAVDSLCRVAEMFAGMHLMTDHRRVPLREIEERIQAAEEGLLKRQPARR